MRTATPKIGQAFAEWMVARGRRRRVRPTGPVVPRECPSSASQRRDGVLAQTRATSLAWLRPTGPHGRLLPG